MRGRVRVLFVAGGLLTGCTTGHFGFRHPSYPLVAPPAPCLELGPTHVQFAGLNVFDDPEHPVDIEIDNACEGALELQDAYVIDSPAFDVDPPEDLLLVGGASTTMRVTFRPVVPGEHEGGVILETNDPSSPEAMIRLSGLAHTGE